MEQKVIILRGVETSGVVKELQKSDEKMILLRESEIEDSLIGELEILLGGGASVVIEGVFQEPRVLEEILSASAALGVPCLVFEIGKVELSRKDAVKLDLEKNSAEECKKIILDAYKDWDKESPRSEGAFVFLVRDKKILMSLTSYSPEVKFYSGYGGGVDADETPEEAVVREVKEEADVEVLIEDLRKVAIITRVTKHIPENTQSVFVLTIFLCDRWEGEVKDLPGMKSEWFEFNKIPLEQVHAGNELWLPKVLEGKLIKMDSAFVNNQGDEKPQLINREVREVDEL